MVLVLPENELGELARHMGHELSVHRQYYRLQEDITELAKISKLLLLADRGKAHKFSKRNLDDIQLNDLFEEKEDCEVGGTDGDDNEVTEDGNLKDLAVQEEQIKVCKAKRVHSKMDSYQLSDEESRNESDTDEVTSSTVIKRHKAERTEWKQVEIEALTKYLLPTVKRNHKPPQKKDILRVQEMVPELEERTWISIKYRTWAMYQKQDKISKKLLSNF